MYDVNDSSFPFKDTGMHNTKSTGSLLISLITLCALLVMTCRHSFCENVLLIQMLIKNHLPQCIFFLAGKNIYIMMYYSINLSGNNSCIFI